MGGVTFASRVIVVPYTFDARDTLIAINKNEALLAGMPIISKKEALASH